MATIGQICDYMNERKATWWPQYVCDIELIKQGENGDDQCVEKHQLAHRGTTIVYTRVGGQRFIGHYFEYENHGNCVEWYALFPLNNGHYLKAKIKY